MLASTILTNVSNALQDAGNVRWTSSELLGYLNQGQREIALYKPNTSITNAAVQLVAGTKQTLPTGALTLVALIRNMGAGTTAGNAIRMVSRGAMDAQLPDWHLTTASGVVKNYMYSDMDPAHFYVYPPQPVVPTYVEMIYSVVPTDCATVGSAIALDDIYATALFNYVMFRAWSKDAEYASNAAFAQLYYSSFASLIGVKLQAEAASFPNKGAA